MKFAIVSDTHDNIKNFNKIIAWLNQQNIATILHCGDICNQEIINEAEKNFKGEIVYVRGNGDYGLRDLPDTEELDLVHKKDLVFYGHTHKPWEEKVGNCRLVNPGEVAGQRFKPTFALYDTQTDKLELKILEKL